MHIFCVELRCCFPICDNEVSEQWHPELYALLQLTRSVQLEGGPTPYSSSHIPCFALLPVSLRRDGYRLVSIQQAISAGYHTDISPHDDSLIALRGFLLRSGSEHKILLT